MAGLTPLGLEILRLPEVLEEIETSERQLIDPNISVTEDTVLGQMNNIIGSSLADLWALMQAVNDNFNIDVAEGKNLDDLATLRGVTRFPATRSNTDRQQFVGNNGTVIQANSLFSNIITGDRFFNPSVITLDSSSCLSANLSVQQVINLETYNITVNGINYEYIASGAATASEIVTALAALINGDAAATWSATVDGTILTVSSDDTSTIQIVVITFISVDQITVEGRIEAQEFGPIVAPPNSIENIVTIIPGLISTTNILQLVLGREEESDEELRQRTKTAGSSDCTGTIPSIEMALLNNVIGVTSAIVVENVLATHDFDISDIVGTFIAGETVVGGTSGAEGTIVEIVDANTISVRVCGVFFEELEEITGITSAATATLDKDFPPHTYETIVVGGDNTDVAQEIWRTKPAGIHLYGNTNVLILDSNGNIRSIDFTRPLAVSFAVRVQYTIYDEEQFPVGGNGVIVDTVVEHINSLGIDVDVITGRMFGPIYSAVSGIDELIVEIQIIPNAGDPPNPGSWQVATIPIDIDEFANITEIDVTVLNITP
jgi:uncharacterized phage protein gp47/JayE